MKLMDLSWRMGGRLEESPVEKGRPEELRVRGRRDRRVGFEKDDLLRFDRPDRRLFKGVGRGIGVFLANGRGDLVHDFLLSRD